MINIFDQHKLLKYFQIKVVSIVIYTLDMYYSMVYRRKWNCRRAIASMKMIIGCFLKKGGICQKKQGGLMPHIGGFGFKSRAFSDKSDLARYCINRLLYDIITVTKEIFISCTIYGSRLNVLVFQKKLEKIGLSVRW